MRSPGFVVVAIILAFTACGSSNPDCFGALVRGYRFAEVTPGSCAMLPDSFGLDGHGAGEACRRPECQCGPPFAVTPAGAATCTTPYQQSCPGYVLDCPALSFPYDQFHATGTCTVTFSDGSTCEVSVEPIAIPRQVG